MVSIRSKLEQIVRICEKRGVPKKFYCDKVYVSDGIKCKYHGRIIHVISYKDGVRGYSIRYECKKTK